MTVTSELAEFAADFKLPSGETEVGQAAKVAILDGFGCLMAGTQHPLIGVLTDYAARIGGTEESTIVGTTIRNSVTNAAFVNGAMLHCMDFEPQGLPSIHGTSNLLPPALALAESIGASGADVVEAFVVGWDVQARLRTASAKADLRGFHPPAIFGPLGAAAASGKLLKLDAGQMAMAFGIAASRAGGLLANNGTMVKSTHPGNAGRMGLESALLAKLGLISNSDIFGPDTIYGYVPTLFDGEFDVSVLLRDLGTSFRLVDPGFSIKQFPAEISLQRVACLAQPGLDTFRCTSRAVPFASSSTAVVPLVRQRTVGVRRERRVFSSC